MKKNYLAFGIVSGVILGTILGLIFSNISLYVGFCSAAGWMLGLYLDQRKNY